MGKGTFEIALIGDFQCGKSTVFGVMCGGRALSPQGRGVKTSACAITARALQSDGASEYAEWHWRDPGELKQFADCVLNQPEEEFDADQSLRRSALLIRRFNETPELGKWRKRKHMSMHDSRTLLSYPEDWETRWLGDPSGRGIKLAEVLFLFVRRVIFNVHSEKLKSLGCEITDCPGFDAGLWDMTLAREVMLRSNLILCVVNGSKGTVAQQYLDCLEWISRLGMARKVGYAMNVWKSRKTAEEQWRAVNVATLRQRGLPVADVGMKVFNAWLAFASLNIALARKSPLYGLKSLSRRIMEVCCKVVGRKAPVDEISMKTANSLVGYSDIVEIEELRSAIDAPERLWTLSGFGEVLDDLRAFRVDRKKTSGVSLGHPGMAVSALGVLTPMPGYAWKDDASFVVRVAGGVVWSPDLEHSAIAHIVAQEEEGAWRPLVGYAWKDTGLDDVRFGDLVAVVWQPGCGHRTVPNVLAADKEGEWRPARGYDWIDPTTRETMLERGVRWKPGLEYGDGKHLVSGRSEGEWLPSPVRTRGEIVKAFKWIHNPRLYVGGTASERKVRNARNDMRISSMEEMVVQFDDTIFRGGGDGFAVTCCGIYAKALGEDPLFKRWDEIGRVRVQDKRFTLNRSTVSLGFMVGEDLVKSLEQAFHILV